MKYNNTQRAIFIKRPNRFVAEILIDGKSEKAHVPNTGRCKEIFLPNSQVVVAKSDNPKRKLKYSLLSVYKGDMLINIDSQNPNRIVHEALCDGRLLGFVPKTVQREYTYGSSRLDFMFGDEKAGKGLIEVKGCTLEKDGKALFPDAPTERGVKHLRELIKAREEGWLAYVVFAIQMKGVECFCPNRETHSEFADTLWEAYEKGVVILGFDSVVTEDAVRLDKKIPVIL